LIQHRDKDLAVVRGMVSAKMKDETSTQGIAWKEWSKEAFEEAGRSGKLVLLDLSADWCHWCHVMDRTTYSDPEVIETVNRELVPVRVDIDARPDVSERYNRGGFPTTAFLSDRGESIWGATYIPPKDMKRIVAGVLAAKASGEIEEALEKSRMMYLDVKEAAPHASPVDEGLVDALFEDIFATYDTEHGGFGLYPKFPHPDVLDLLLLRHLLTGEEEVTDAIQTTIERMTRGLYDDIEGGVFRYSVTRDWREPHYEKMLQTNAGFLRNLAAAHRVFKNAEYEDTAAGVARFMLSTLRDESSGGFRGSQDADEKYYGLSASERTRARRPPVVPTVYGGWNAEAVSALIDAGTTFHRKEWLDAAEGGWDYTMARLWNRDLGLIRHQEDVELYLFEDQVAFLEALLSVYSLKGRPELLELASELVSRIDMHFAHPEGGFVDIVNDPDAVGELGERRRPLVANSKYARLLAILSVAAHDPRLSGRPSHILDSFSKKELEAHGLFAAEYLISWQVLREGAKVVSVRAPGEDDVLSNAFLAAARSVHNPAVLCTPDPEAGPSSEGAVICTTTGCSEPILDPSEVASRIRVAKAEQV